jgi:hypothetical protein
MKHIDPNIDRIVGLLSKAKSALDETHRLAKEYQEVDADLARTKGYIADELELIESKDDSADPEALADYRKQAERIEAEHILLASELAISCKNLEDYLGYAGRVSDHFNGKVYPMGMKPL